MQDPSSSSHPQLRRAWLSGYRVVDVELLLAKFGVRVSQLWQEGESLRERLAAAERDREALERRLGESHQRELELVSLASTAQATRDQALAEARKEARGVIDAAHLDAARIRGEAVRDADVARGQVDELFRLRGTLSSTMHAVVREFEGLVGRIDRGDEQDAVIAAVAWPPAVPYAPSEQASSVPPESMPSEPATVGARSDVFDGRIELDAGPFADFASLSAFERALGALPKIEDVYIRRFQGDRATIDLKLQEPAPLLDEMAAHLPYRFAVDHSDLDHIALTVSNGA